MHSGIGSIERLLEIKDIVRPIKAKGNSTVADLLWSGGDTEKGLGYDTKISNEAIVDKFLEENGL